MEEDVLLGAEGTLVTAPEDRTGWLQQPVP